MEKTAVESLKLQISLTSSTFQGRRFPLKFGTHAYNEVLHQTVLQISPADQEVGQMSFTSNLMTLADVWRCNFQAEELAKEKTVVP